MSKTPQPRVSTHCPWTIALQRSRGPRDHEPEGWEEKYQDERDAQDPIQPFLRLADPIEQQDGKEEGLDENLRKKQELIRDWDSGVDEPFDRTQATGELTDDANHDECHPQDEPTA